MAKSYVPETCRLTSPYVKSSLDYFGVLKNKNMNNKIKAKKSLGQNFLTDDSVLFDIVEAVEPQPTDTIVEIGPGHGALTLPLLESGAKVIGIEKDSRLTAELKTINPRLLIVEGDALEILANSENYKLLTKNYKLVGNIPYYITGHLFRVIGEMKDKPSLIVFMIQKEVAERICAGAGMNPVRNREGSKRASVSNGMNLLAASIQIWAEPQIVRFVSRKAFDPQPKIDSAVIKLTPHKKSILKEKELEKYYELLHTVFKQPRKTIFNNLRAGGFQAYKIEPALKKINMDLKARPQDLSVENLKNLSNILR